MQNRHPNENNWNKRFDNNGNNSTKKKWWKLMNENVYENAKLKWIFQNETIFRLWLTQQLKNVSFMLFTLNGFLLYVVKLIEISCFPYLCISKNKFIKIKLKNVFCFSPYFSIFSFSWYLYTKSTYFYVADWNHCNNIHLRWWERYWFQQLTSTT